MLNRIEHARVRSNGQKVLVLRRSGIARDLDIMAALEANGSFVIGTPGGFRYRKANARHFIRPAADDVFILDKAGRAVTAVVPAPYFAAHYEVIPALSVVDGGVE